MYNIETSCFHEFISQIRRIYLKKQFVISIERKYSDSLSFEDIYGYPDLNAKKSVKIA